MKDYITSKERLKFRRSTTRILLELFLFFGVFIIFSVGGSYV